MQLSTHHVDITKLATTAMKRVPFALLSTKTAAAATLPHIAPALDGLLDQRNRDAPVRHALLQGQSPDIAVRAIPIYASVQEMQGDDMDRE
eukprot:NODE_10111_length_1376_cov_3.506005.p5 GENE.NODE_10111_length_1376_cov_3.506005~~NODE_10111_length_1376_cov_3.506005.p5  ORF type:complete len:91 (-),score=9.93 NODE_10111_length_1376_cov_3.506005:759-1031(-)